MTAPIWPVASGTGHRPQHLAPAMREWLPGELDRIAVKLRDTYGTRVGISGMALGFDLWWASSILRAGLDLWAYVPYPAQAERWPAADRAEWERLLDRAAKVRRFGVTYSVRVLHARNDGMLSDSDCVVAGWRPSKTDGGTASAVAKANRRLLPMVHLNPDTLATALHLVPPVGSGLTLAEVANGQ